ncbi:MAG: hypothetical protein HRT54_19970 [Colwellia sp.]|nr:hypothetical protein [Colwellia sp.]
MKKVNVLIIGLLLFFHVSSFADFTIGVIPDTQFMSESDKEAKKITKMIKYFVDNKEALNVVFIASLGDMTQHKNSDSEWQRVKFAYQQLADAGIAYAPSQGNHDATKSINKWFPVSDFEKSPTWGGSFNNKIENAFYEFTAEGMEFLLLQAQWEGDQAVKNWANGIFNANPSKRGIFVAHLIDQGTPYETDIITQNNNIFMSLSGHRDKIIKKGREEYWTTKSANGSIQHNVMTDYQAGNIYKDKGATIRRYTFKPQKNEICAFTWNTTHEIFETDANSQFCMPYKMSE